MSMLEFITGYVMGERTATRSAAFARAAGAADATALNQTDIDLDLRIDRLLLVVEAMWSLLKDHGYTDEQMASRIRLLDAEDGDPDGRRTLRPSRCPRCDSMVEPGRSTCTYCGASIQPTSGPMDHV